MFKHILVPTDGSPLSQNAVRNAVSFAKECGARITSFHAMPEIRTTYYGDGVVLDPAVREYAEKQAEEAAQEALGFVENLCIEYGVSCSKLTWKSDIPYESIIKAATDSNCDLIFMASHGRKGISALLLGSETSKVLTHSKIPVLVYR